MNINSNMEEFVYTGRGQTVPKDVVRVRFDPSVTEVEEEAFIECTQLREVVFNEGLKKIGNRAFMNCQSLSESISLPSSLTDIDERAFLDCSCLKEVRLCEGLQKIGDSAFGRCFSLQSISLPSTLMEIDKYALYCCTNLREVRLHAGLQTIGQNAFARCSSLERFNFPSLSTRLNNIMQTGHHPIVEANVDEVRGVVERRGNELFVPGAVIGVSSSNVMVTSNWNTFQVRGGSSWNTIKASLDQILSWIRYYEIKEATTLFELALWKAKIDQVDSSEPTTYQEACTYREACRIEVPGPVKDTILQYL